LTRTPRITSEALFRTARRLGAAAIGLGLAAVLNAGPARAGADTDELGRRIFLEGRNARGEPIRAVLGVQGLALTGAPVACGNCHGADGRGRPEGGVVPPDITWDELTKPYGHVRPGGRRHGPFDERSFALSVTEGIDPDGQRIDGAMPRYSLSRSEMDALIAYLQRLAQVRDPGIGENVLRLGTVLPSAGSAAELGGAVRAVLATYADEVNAQGGVHGRKLEIVVVPDLAAARESFAKEPVFALVSPYGVGAERELAALAREQRLAVVAPLTLAAPADSPPQVFYLYPGLAELARVLLDFAGRRADLKVQRLVAFADEPAVAEALRIECRRRQCSGLDVLPAHSAAEPGAVAELAHSGVEGIVFAGGNRELATLLRFADRLGWRPAIYVPGAAASRALIGAPAAFSGKLFVAYPTRGEQQAGTAAAEAFEQLREKHALGKSHAAAQGFAYAAMSIAIEALRQSGRDLSRERFLRAIEGLHRFDAGPTPPVSYGPGRRVGALGGYVLAVEPGKGFRTVSGWITLEPL